MVSVCLTGQVTVHLNQDARHSLLTSHIEMMIEEVTLYVLVESSLDFVS